MEDLVITSPEVRNQKRNEFLAGKNPDGSQIGGYRDFSYARAKNMQNPLAGFGQVDLILTGNFQRSLYVRPIAKGRFLFTNQLDYGNDLISKYGDGILGENQDAFNRIQKVNLSPQLRKFIKTKLGQ